jgi:hypothetical protein
VKQLFFFLLIVLSTTQVWAWGHRGHEIVGKIAQSELSPQAQEALAKLFGKNLNLGVEATFPDRVRGNRTYDRFKPWHYADHPTLTLAKVLGNNFPKPENQKPEEKAAIPFIESLIKDHAYLVADHAPKGDALQALFFLEGVLKSPRSTKEQKIFAIRYIAHILGDIHMPLHIGSGLDTGGNACVVKWKGESEKVFHNEDGDAKVPMNLHIVWDDQIPDEKLCGSTSCSSDQYSQLLRSEYKDTIKNQKLVWIQGTSLDWAKESGDFREKIYPVIKDANGEPVVVEGKISGRPYCKKGNETIAAEYIPDLGAEYYGTWKQTAEVRMIQAGLRLAARLNAVLGGVTRRQ